MDKLTYWELISGDEIPIDKVGHIRSPKLWELKPTKGIGEYMYNLYINAIIWEREDYINFILKIDPKKANILINNKDLNAYDIATSYSYTKNLLQKAIDFFVIENLSWNDGERRFDVYSKEDKEKIVGYIDRENFEEIKDVILQLNYMNLGEEAKPLKFSNNKAKEIWERAQKLRKEKAQKEASKNENMELGNIVSKICASGIGYTLLNIEELTVFQLYDQFFQLGYYRAMNIADMAYSNHGGENFDMQEWLKTINNKK